MTKELIAKLEALEEPDVDVFLQVFNVVCPEHESKTPRKWGRRQSLFIDRLHCRAWESAAIMLKPEGSLYELSEEGDCAALNYDKSARRVYAELEGRNPSIALLICILKAKEPVE